MGRLKADLELPGLQAPVQFHCPLRLPPDQVVLFGRIALQIVELQRSVLEPLDELPAARPDGGRGPVPGAVIVREMPEEGVAVDCSGLPEQRAQIAPISLRIGSVRLSGQSQQGGVEIVADDRLGTEAPGPDSSRPAHDQRFPDPPLVEPPLAGPQREIAGRTAASAGHGAQAAVVRHEDHHRLLFQSQFGQPVKEAADAPVNRRHHPGVFGLVLAQAGPGPLMLAPERGLPARLPLPGRPVGGGILLPALHRGMDRVMREEE
jgi:hypothetical protein